MIKQLKQFTVNLISGANVATVCLMLAAGFSDRIDPASHPTLACLGMAFPIFLVVNLLFLLFWLVFKWRKAWIPVAGFLLAYIPISTYMPLNPRQDIPEGSIKLVSYNVCSYNGAGIYGDVFDKILSYINEQDADIVCIQEDIDTWRKYLMDRYRKTYPYNDTTLLAVSEAGINCVGLHSRYPILRKERISYPSRGNGTVAYYLQKDKDTLLVINNHLECTHLTKEERSRYKNIIKGEVKGDTARAESMQIISKLGQTMARRAPQAEAVHRYVEAHSQYPTIVCGDFNDTPISYTHHVIADGLTDCFRASGCGIGLSYNQKGFWVRIDHILCSSDFVPYNCHVDSKIDFSDHYPMICWLKMKDKY